MTLPHADDKLVLNQCQVVCKVGIDLKPSEGSLAEMMRSECTRLCSVLTLLNRVHYIVYLHEYGL
jgi:hypothetical protein